MESFKKIIWQLIFLRNYLNKVPVYFWINFKLKREQEIAVESTIMTQDVLVVLLTTYGKSYILQTYVIASGQQNNTKVFAHLPALSKTRLPKQDHLESSVCP